MQNEHFLRKLSSWPPHKGSWVVVRAWLLFANYSTLISLRFDMQQDKFQKKVDFFTLSPPLPQDNEWNTSNAGEGITMKIKDGCHWSYLLMNNFLSQNSHQEKKKHLQGFNIIPCLEKMQKSKLADICRRKVTKIALPTTMEANAV